MSDTSWFCYTAIQTPSDDTTRCFSRAGRKSRNGSPKSRLAATLRADDSYMEQLARDQIDYWVQDGVYDDVWAECCKKRAHAAYCPHENPDEYRADLERRLSDEAEKRTWLQEYMFDWEDIRDQINDCCEDGYFVEQFLKEHPITGVLVIDCGERRVIDIDNIVGYCPSCDTPAEAHNLLHPDVAEKDEILQTELVCSACNYHGIVGKLPLPKGRGFALNGEQHLAACPR